MSEDLIIALVGLAGIVLGAVIQQIGSAARNNLEAYRLAQRMQTDNSLLWQWNRELVDHIYKRSPPPPPAPPAGLFTDNHE
jgi:uncharacterized membrane-anchored protein YhcB (DUF1043 family)